MGVKHSKADYTVSEHLYATKISKKDQHMSILFYISGHGFGHSTRMNALIRKLKTLSSETEVFIRSNAPKWIFLDDIGETVDFFSIPIDTGTYQTDFIHLDKKKTFEKYEELIQRRDLYIERELRFIADNKIQLIVGDIPPMAFLIAKKAGVKSVGVSNFSWDWIFEPYLKEYPEYKILVDDIKECYGYADILLRLPFCGVFSSFKRIEDMPLLVRSAKMDKDEVRHLLGLKDEKRPIILCSFGGFKIKGFSFKKVVSENPDYFFISFGAEYFLENNLMVLPFRNRIDHPSLVNTADVVVSKLGYGTVAECVSTSTPIVYLPRDDFREYPVLVEGVKENIPFSRITEEDFFNGNWKRDLDFLINNTEKNDTKILLNGDIKIAEFLLKTE